MKKLISFVLFLGLLSSALANVGQVNTLSSTALKIVQPGARCIMITIQNNGANSVRLSVDGGSTYTDPNTGKKGTDPTPTTGYVLAAGASVTLNFNIGAYPAPVVAVMVTGSTTLDIITNDYGSTFPTP